MADHRRFVRLVEDAIATLPDRLGAPLAGVPLHVAEIPPADDARPGFVTLAQVHLAGPRARRASRLTVYRRPLESRSRTRVELVDLIRTAVGMEVARALGIDDDLDDLFDEGDEV